ncbi:hypothetical protein K458DRAFT_312356, partial [Lentithecium fluviatile CBS 122367]
FLGVYLIRDRVARTITLIHDTYINKIIKKFNLIKSALFPSTPLLSKELIKNIRLALKLILYTAIILQPNIAFAVLQLLHFLTNLSAKHFKAAN